MRSSKPLARDVISVLALAAILGAGERLGQAQSTYATLTGTVTDATGAVLPRCRSR